MLAEIELEVVGKTVRIKVTTESQPLAEVRVLVYVPLVVRVWDPKV
jgi:hypothetical protein